MQQSQWNQTFSAFRKLFVRPKIIINAHPKTYRPKCGIKYAVKTYKKSFVMRATAGPLSGWTNGRRKREPRWDKRCANLFTRRQTKNIRKRAATKWVAHPSIRVRLNDKMAERNDSQRTKDNERKTNEKNIIHELNCRQFIIIICRQYDIEFDVRYCRYSSFFLVDAVVLCCFIASDFRAMQRMPWQVIACAKLFLPLLPPSFTRCKCEHWIGLPMVVIRRFCI